MSSQTGRIDIHNFEDFLRGLDAAGFSMGGENGEGIFTLCDHFGPEIQWHVEQPDTDPWEWRMRVLNERDDIVYGKFFFKKSGYITKEWYPYFYAVRRGQRQLQEEYENGNVSQTARHIYELIEEHKELPLNLIKQYGGFGKEDKSKFDRALVELQTGCYVTMCGRARKQSKSGAEYGWHATVFCLADEFFDPSVVTKAQQIPYEEAYKAIEEQVRRLNPQAEAKKIRRFITG